MQRAWRREGGRERGREKRKFVGTYDPANLLDRGRSALLESHAATNDRLAIRRGPIEHALKQCVPVLMYEGDSVQMMEAQDVMFVNAKQLCLHAAAATAAAAALHPPWRVQQDYDVQAQMYTYTQAHMHSLSFSVPLSP